jgi:uncharacterized protein DUF3800
VTIFDSGRYEVRLPEPPEREKWVSVFHVYADESGKFGNDKCEYISLCGLVGHVSEWARVQLEWNNCLFRWQVPPIHMAHIKRPEEHPEWKKIKDDWGNNWEVKRDRMLLEFAQLIGRSNVASVGAVVDAKHFRLLPDSPLKAVYDEPLKFAFHELVSGSIEKTEAIDKCSPIGLVIDDDHDTAHVCHSLLSSLKIGLPKVRHRISSICFVNDRFFPGVQAADMLAYESRRLMVEKITDPAAKGAELIAELTCTFKHQPKLLSAETLDRINSDSIKKGFPSGEG